MKLSDLLKFADSIKESVSDLMAGLEAKFSVSLESVKAEIKAVEEAHANAATVEAVEELRAALAAQSMDIRTEIEAKASSGPPVSVKQIFANGKSVTVELSDGAAETFEIPVIAGVDGVNGKDGVNGTDGKDGVNGINGVGIKEIQAQEDRVVFMLSNGEDYRIPLPKPEAPAMPAEPRAPIDITDSMIDRNNDLILTFSNGTTKNVGRIVGRDGVDGKDGIDGKDGRDGLDGVGRPGEDGRDGFGFDDLDVSLMDDKRTVMFRFTKGENVKEFPIKFPNSIFRGAYAPEMVYEEGDEVAFLGATYHANAETVGNPPGSSDFWTQKAAPGRSVRGPRGIAGKDGTNGTNGKDLRSFT